MAIVETVAMAIVETETEVVVRLLVLEVVVRLLVLEVRPRQQVNSQLEYLTSSCWTWGRSSSWHANL
jgi:hypothetical protein